MSQVPYTYQRQFRKSGREVAISLVLGACLTLIFTCQYYGWLLGHHPNLGEPMFWVSQRLDGWLSIGLLAAGALALPSAYYKYWSFFNRSLLVIALIIPFYFGAIYNPFRQFLWLYSYWEIPEMQWIHQQIAIYGILYFSGISFMLIMSIPRKVIEASGAYGTAKLETADKFKAGVPQTKKEKKGTAISYQFILNFIKELNLGNDINPYHKSKLYSGIIIGRHYLAKKPIALFNSIISVLELIGLGSLYQYYIQKGLLFYRGDRHLMTVAPTRSGKGTGYIITNALTYPYNFFVVDPKGEICSISWERRKEMGQDVYCLDPWKESTYAMKNEPHGFNPLDYVPSSGKGAYDKCSQITQCIVTDNMNRGESHWLKSARSLSTGLILYVCRAPKYNDPSHEEYVEGKRNLLTVFDLLNLPQKKFDKFIKQIIGSDELGSGIKSFANTISKKEGKELSGVISTAEENYNRFIHSDALRESLKKSDFNIDEAILNPSSLYIIVPDDKIDQYKSWLRLVVNTILDRAVQVKDTVQASAEEERILIILDEFKALGYLKKIEQAYTTLAGYGFSMWIFTQNLANIKNLYRDEWRTFKANSGIFQAFNTNDFETAKYISDEGGKTTMLTESESENRRKGDIGINRRSGDSTSIREKQRDVLFPDEVKRLPDTDQLLLPIGENISLAKKIEFFNDPYFTGLFTKREEIAQLIEKALKEDSSLSDTDNLPIYNNGNVTKKENSTEQSSKNKKSKTAQNTTDGLKENYLEN
jgi:type IV secretion system protein VirD4